MIAIVVVSICTLGAKPYASAASNQIFGTLLPEQTQEERIQVAKAKLSLTDDEVSPNLEIKYGTKEELLLNNEYLRPMYTNEEYVDNKVQEIFAELFTDEMSNYEKVSALYTYIHENYYYKTSFIGPKTQYAKNYDRQMVGRCKGFFQTGHGTCTEYSACFMVMLRALGYNAYCVHGSFSTSGQHTWVVVYLAGEKYTFDPEVDSVVAKRLYGGELRYLYFCLGTEDEFRAKYHPANEQGDINSFGNFHVAQAE